VAEARANVQHQPQGNYCTWAVPIVHVALFFFSFAGARLSVDPDCSQLRVHDLVPKAILQPAFVRNPPLRHIYCPTVIRVINVVVLLALVLMPCCTCCIIVVAGVGGVVGVVGVVAVHGTSVVAKR
jgi:hypothetical protein